MADRGVATDARVDSHVHVWDLAVREQPWTAGLPELQRSFAVEELETELTRHDIAAAVVVQTVPDVCETPELLTVARETPAICGVVGWLDVTAGDVRDRLAQLTDDALVGIRHGVQDEPDPRWLCRPDVRRGLAAVGEAGLIYDLLVVPAQLPAAIETVAALPEVRFVLDHIAKPRIAVGADPSWRADIARLAALPNVAVKLSGLITEAASGWTVADLAPWAARVLEAFGPERVMFGSDWPVCRLAGGYSAALDAATHLTSSLTVAEQSAIFGGTARAWYGLR